MLPKEDYCIILRCLFMSSKRQKCIDCNRREDGGISEKSEKWEIYYNKNSLDRIVTEIFKTL